MVTPLSPIIYHSDSLDVVLLDLPRSIEHAQSSPFQLRSTAALAHPYPSTEPYGVKLTEILKTIHPERLRQAAGIEQEVANALNRLNSQLEIAHLSWGYLRYESVPSTTPQALRRAERGSDKLEYLAHHHVAQDSHPAVVLSSTESNNIFRNWTDIRDTAVCNPGGGTSMEVGGTSHWIPPKSTFILSSVLNAQPMFNALAGEFDLILMDPPWSNRSVRRSGKYSTNERQPKSVFLSTLPILETHLKPQGLVAVWVTNKQVLKDLILKALGSLDLHLQREWVWVKVTSKGEPVTDLKGVWRKPYEELLIFGRAALPLSRRIIVAVPDLHSRKPSLKTLFDKLLPHGYQALELFARSLTAGWWSSGDQVLHFQDASEWRSSQSYVPQTPGYSGLSALITAHLTNPASGSIP